MIPQNPYFRGWDVVTGFSLPRCHRCNAPVRWVSYVLEEEGISCYFGCHGEVGVSRLPLAVFIGGWSYDVFVFPELLPPRWQAFLDRAADNFDAAFDLGIADELGPPRIFGSANHATALGVPVEEQRRRYYFMESPV